MTASPGTAWLERKARAIAQLSHPNILAIHDFERQGDVAFTPSESHPPRASAAPP
jgi:hypothetical protein